MLEDCIYPIDAICYQSAVFMSTQGIRTNVLRKWSEALWPHGYLAGNCTLSLGKILYKVTVSCRFLFVVAING